MGPGPIPPIPSNTRSGHQIRWSPSRSAGSGSPLTYSASSNANPPPASTGRKYSAVIPGNAIPPAFSLRISSRLPPYREQVRNEALDTGGAGATTLVSRCSFPEPATRLMRVSSLIDSKFSTESSILRGVFGVICRCHYTNPADRPMTASGNVAVPVGKRIRGRFALGSASGEDPCPRLARERGLGRVEVGDDRAPAATVDKADRGLDLGSHASVGELAGLEAAA